MKAGRARKRRLREERRDARRLRRKLFKLRCISYFISHAVVRPFNTYDVSAMYSDYRIRLEVEELHQIALNQRSHTKYAARINVLRIRTVSRAAYGMSANFPSVDALKALEEHANRIQAEMMRRAFDASKYLSDPPETVTPEENREYELRRREKRGVWKDDVQMENAYRQALMQREDEKEALVRQFGQWVGEQPDMRTVGEWNKVRAKDPRNYKRVK